MARPEQEGWAVEWANGGWLGIDARPEGSGERMLVRVAPDEDGRLRVRELHLRDTDEPITAQRLRAVRIGAIEAMANGANEYQTIMERYEFPPAGPIGSENFFDPYPGMRPISAAELAELLQEQQPSLAPPAKRGYPDEFYAEVAEAYRAAVRRGDRAPVTVIANDTGVPRSTAARWVKEARRRGKLGKGTPGRKGERA
jgi:hypothetical protein